MSRRIGASTDGLAGLCMASVLGAVIMTPVGAIAAGHRLLGPSTLAIGLAVGPSRTCHLVLTSQSSPAEYYQVQPLVIRLAWRLDRVLAG